MGLFTTLPIYWAETDDIAGMLRGAEPRHWARELIEQRHAIKPLDSLAQSSGSIDAPLDSVGLLLMAQPRVLSPQENVAVDSWVRRGGRLLLFADPMLTADSRFPLGDRRRPQEVALLSPLLTHWGLQFSFDPAQPADEREISLVGTAMPVEMAGTLALSPGGSCVLLGDGLAADCAIGKGRALVIADAALFDATGEPGESRPFVLAALLARAFDR